MEAAEAEELIVIAAGAGLADRDMDVEAGAVKGADEKDKWNQLISTNYQKWVPGECIPGK